MPRFSALARALLPLTLLAGLATGCGNKGPLFLPPPAVHEPEGAAPPAASPSTTGDATSENATSENATSENAASGEAGSQAPAASGD